MDLPDIEETAALVHEAWMSQKLAEGCTSRLSPDGHEQMVPYEELPEDLKNLNRETVRTVYDAIIINHIRSLKKESANG